MRFFIYVLWCVGFINGYMNIFKYIYIYLFIHLFVHMHIYVCPNKSSFTIILCFLIFALNCTGQKAVFFSGWFFFAVNGITKCIFWVSLMQQIFTNVGNNSICFFWQCVKDEKTMWLCTQISLNFVTQV